MARPLREQLLVATLVVILPVIAVITFTRTETIEVQVERIDELAADMAVTIAAHINESAVTEVSGVQGFLDQLSLPPSSRARVTDAAGRVARTARTGTFVDEMRAGLASATRVPWEVRVEIPTELAWDRARPIYVRTMLITGLVTAILLLIQLVFLRRWLPALHRFERDAERIGSGNLQPLEPWRMPSRELEHLRASFAEMVEKLRDAQESLAAQADYERKMREELQLLQQQVIRQERLAAIGVLLSGIAHELNNPLQAIAGFAELLRRDPDVKAEVREDLALIQKESARASAIIRNLSRFSRQQGAKPSIVLISEVVASVVELRQRRLQEQNIELQLDEEASLLVRAVFTELQQVLLNFVINAHQAIVDSDPPVRRIVIRTRDRDGFLRVEVEDTGPGVDPDDEGKLFQPFYTTKPVGEGTGLGLSVSYGIIRSTGGTIGYERSDGGGARFYIELPQVEDAPPT